MIKGIWQDPNGDWWTEEVFMQLTQTIEQAESNEFGIAPKVGGNFIRPATADEIDLINGSP